MIWRDLLTLKCSEQTSVPPAIVYSLPSSQRIPWIHYFPVHADVEQFLSLLLAFKNTKTSRHSEMKQTRPSTKQDFSGEALSKQNTEASLASLSWLVLGDDQVVRHICIRCMAHEIFIFKSNSLKIHENTIKFYRVMKSNLMGFSCFWKTHHENCH